MKTIVTFIAGAILASGLMYFVVGRKSEAPAPAATAQQQQLQPATPAPVETPQASVVGGNSAGTAPAITPAPAPQTGGFKPHAASSPKPAANASSSKNGKTGTTGTPSQPPASQPQQTAQNTPPPPSNPNGGPMVPYDPVRSSLPPPPEDRRPEPPKRVPKTVTIPAGTLLTVRVDQSLSTQRNKAGDAFPATLDQPLVVDGMVIAERGSKVEGRVVDADPGGRVSGVASMHLELVRLNTSDGQKVRVATDSFSKEAPKETKKDVAKVGAAAGIGAAIGAIAGGGRGAAIGAAVGGAAGTGGVMATRGGPAQVAAETRVSFRLREPLTITERLN